MLRSVVLVISVAMTTIPAAAKDTYATSPGTMAVRNASFSIETVVGKLTAACEKVPGSALYGAYHYRLGNRTIAISQDDCAPGGALTFVVLNRSWADPEQTTLLAVEGHSTIDQVIRLFHFRRGLPPLMVVTSGGDILSAARMGRDKFGIVVRGVGFGASVSGLKSYKCQFEVDFAARSVETRLFGPRDRGVPKDICGIPRVELEELRIR